MVTVASASIAFTGRRSGANRCPGRGVTRIVYVAGRTVRDAAPAAPVSVQLSSPEVGAAQTAAPATGVPSWRLTRTLTDRCGVGVPAGAGVGGGGAAWHAASASARHLTAIELVARILVIGLPRRR
jgi:hypothetical protein